MFMATETKPWTLEELHRLPDDGNKYELVRGELFVTPPPNEMHEDILARLTRILDPFVEANGLGLVYRAKAVWRVNGSEVEPDLMVRQPNVRRVKDWENAPTPALIVEVLSGSTRRRDHLQKRDFYIDTNVEEYWIIDPKEKSIRQIRADRPDIVVTTVLTWAPSKAREQLSFDVPGLFVR